MIKAVFFDLDDTLLDIDLSSFLRKYSTRIIDLTSQIGSTSFIKTALGFGTGLMAMSSNHDGDVERTNEDIFCEWVYKFSGVPMQDPQIAPAYEEFYRTCVPLLKGSARPQVGGREALEAVLKMGIKPVLMTNPTFPALVTQERMRWAEIDDIPFEFVTTYENCRRCKPFPMYYADACARLGISPQECIMVGNDSRYDIVHPSLGLRTYYMGTERRYKTYKPTWRGELKHLPHLLEQLNTW